MEGPVVSHEVRENLWARLARAALQVYDTLIVLILMALVVVIFLQVASRSQYLPLVFSWSEELSRLLFIWLILLASVRTAHMRITFFVDRLNPRVRAAVNIVLDLVSVVVLAVLVSGGWHLAQLFWTTTYIGMRLSQAWPYIALAPASFLIILVTLSNLPEEWRRLKGASGKGEEPPWR